MIQLHIIYQLRNSIKFVATIYCGFPNMEIAILLKPSMAIHLYYQLYTQLTLSYISKIP